jgi:M6 family metalloprotease-like protein
MIKKGSFLKFFLFSLIVSPSMGYELLIKKTPDHQVTPKERLEKLLLKTKEIEERIEPFHDPLGSLRRLRDKGITGKLRSYQGDTLIIRILAIRVEFVKEDPDDPETTGDGTFRLTDNGEDSLITENGCTYYNPYYDPPHDKKYFEHMMEALANYYKAATFGKVKIEWVIKPDDDSSGYRLPHPMKYYGDMDIWPEGFLALTRDAIKAADEDSTIVLNDLDGNGLIDFDEGIFDRYIIFHAGSAWQTDIMFDTPYDIPAATVLGYPVAIENGTDTIWDVTVLPETMSQDGVESKLQGTLFHENGHNLFFFPDLYDVEMNGAGIGAWGIMGNGYYLGIPGTIPEGLLTPLPNVWERTWIDYVLEYLWGEGAGFLNENFFITLSPSAIPQNLTILPSSILMDSLGNFLKPPDMGPRFYKIPINFHEYYLIEYALDNLPENDSVVCPPETSYVFGKWKEGVVVHFYGENNYLLPGKGLLIWHIDENIFWDNYSYNEVNAVRPMAIDLEEADGVQDLEKWTDISPYPYSWFGGPYDPFFSGNNERFADETNPNTRTNGGGQTKIAIFDISPPETLMTFKVVWEWGQPGFPVELGRATRTYTYSYVSENPYDGYVLSSKNLIFVAQTIRIDSVLVDEYGNEDTLDTKWKIEIHLLDSIGNYLTGDTLTGYGEIGGGPVLLNWGDDDTLEIALPTTSGYLFVFKVASSHIGLYDNFPIRFPDGLFATPSAYDINGDGEEEILISCEDQKLYTVQRDGNILFSIPTGGPGRTTPAIYGDKIYFLSSDGRLLIIGNDGTVEDSLLEPYAITTLSSPAIGDIDRDEKVEILVPTGKGKIYCVKEDGSILWEKELKGPAESSPALGDVDNDGYIEVTFVAGGHLYAINHLGALLSGYPVKLPDTLKTSSPIIFDFGSDGDIEILVGVASKGIFSYNHRGKTANLIPALDGRLDLAPLLTQIDDDSNPELLFIDSTGYLYAWDIPGGDIEWGTYGANQAHTFTYEGSPGTPPPLSQKLSISRVYLYPNPTYTGETNIRFNATKEGWLKVEVYSFGGEFLKSFNYSFRGGDFEERRLDLKDLPSGVYYLRCDFNGEIVKILKIAIVR